MQTKIPKGQKVIVSPENPDPEFKGLGTGYGEFVFFGSQDDESNAPPPVIDNDESNTPPPEIDAEEEMLELVMIRVEINALFGIFKTPSAVMAEIIEEQEEQKEQEVQEELQFTIDI